MIEEIVAVETGNRFVVFEMTKAHAIAANFICQGAHVQLLGKKKNTRAPVELDIGVGDVIDSDVWRNARRKESADF